MNNELNFGGLYKDSKDDRDHIFEHRFLVMDYQLPDKFNLLDKTPEATEQKGVGNCAAHAAACARAMLEGNKDLDLSKAFLYYQARVLAGDTERDCGVTIRNVMKSLRRWGVCETPYMSDELHYRESPSIDAFENAKKYRISEYMRVNTLFGIKTWLYGRKQPVVFGLQVTEDLKSQRMAKVGMMKIPSQFEKAISAHACLIIGWKDATSKDKLLSLVSRRYSSKGYLLVHNSWGQNWSLCGNFWMPYEVILQGRAWDFWIMENKDLVGK